MGLLISRARRQGTAKHAPGRPSAVGRLGRLLLASALLLAAAPLSPAPAPETPTTGEYELKAVFISHFLKYLEWPESAFDGPGSPLVIGVLGEDPFKAALDAVVEELPPIAGRMVVVRRFPSLEAVADAQVLFVPRSERGAGRLARKMCGLPVLTIGEQRGFAEAGGVINFKTDRKRVSFEINTECADAAGIRLSAQLLKLATIVTDSPRGRNG